MRGQSRLGTIIFAVFFLGFIGVFVSQVYRMVFSDPGGLPQPVHTTATVILRETSDATKMERVAGTSTPRTYTLYTITGEYEDGELTKRGKYEVAEDVYFSHEEGDSIDIYYYPGTTLSDYGTPPPRINRSSSFNSMKQVIGGFMLLVAGIMAFQFVRRMLLPAFFGQNNGYTSTGKWSAKLGGKPLISPDRKDTSYDDWKNR